MSPDQSVKEAGEDRDKEAQGCLLRLRVFRVYRQYKGLELAGISRLATRERVYVHESPPRMSTTSSSKQQQFLYLTELGTLDLAKAAQDNAHVKIVIDAHVYAAIRDYRQSAGGECRDAIRTMSRYIVNRDMHVDATIAIMEACRNSKKHGRLTGDGPWRVLPAEKFRYYFEKFYATTGVFNCTAQNPNLIRSVATEYAQGRSVCEGHFSHAYLALAHASRIELDFAEPDYERRLRLFVEWCLSRGVASPLATAVATRLLAKNNGARMILKISGGMSASERAKACRNATWDLMYYLQARDWNRSNYDLSAFCTADRGCWRVLSGITGVPDPNNKSELIWGLNQRTKDRLSSIQKEITHRVFEEFRERAGTISTSPEQLLDLLKREFPPEYEACL